MVRIRKETQGYSQNHLFLGECIPYEGLLLSLPRWWTHLIGVYSHALDLVRVCRSYISANQNTYKLIAVVSLAYLPKQSSNHLYRTPKSEVSFAQGEPLLRSSLFQNLRGSFCDLKFYLWPGQDFTSSEMQSKIGSGHLYKHAEIIHICAGQF